jgi:uncharacterized membrane protein
MPKPARAAEPMNFEKLIGVHLPVWGGAAMLLIAGYFLASMAAANGFFTPTLGVLVCGAAGLGMLVAAFLVRRLRIANGEQISAALASAAIGYTPRPSSPAPFSS